ncbi:MAG TPA: SET domain-containing protein-lysine N-methyltransferase [Solirubrobacteraceae bacterium]|nr:SET domain-containing protein-lysine N-methyltransferase [Solirubrobacteraceae bacterium]
MFATAPFSAGDLVVPGVVGRPVTVNDKHPNQVGINEWVIEDGIGPMLNHSCEPNCGVRRNDSGGYDFIALQGIAVGEELTWDYATRNDTITHFPSVCLCGAPGCRGSITGWRDLDEERKAAYAGFVAPYLLELDALRRVQEPA